MNVLSAAAVATVCSSTSRSTASHSDRTWACGQSVQCVDYMHSLSTSWTLVKLCIACSCRWVEFSLGGLCMPAWLPAAIGGSSLLPSYIKITMLLPHMLMLLHVNVDKGAYLRCSKHAELPSCATDSRSKAPSAEQT